MDEDEEEVGDVGLRIQWLEDRMHNPLPVIVEVVPWSPAMREGTIRVGDVLTSVNGIPVVEVEDIQMLVGPLGSEVLISVLRPKADRKIESQYVSEFEGPVRATLYRDNQYLKRRPVLPWERRWPDPRRYQDISLGFLGIHWTFRRFCIALHENTHWQHICLGVIFLNMAALVMDDPFASLYNPATAQQSLLSTIEFGLSIFFIVESLVAIIARGLYFGHNAYLASKLNMVDFLIFGSCSIEIVLYVMKDYFSSSLALPSSFYTFQSVVRAMRSFRLIRVAAERFEAIQWTVLILTQVLPGIQRAFSINIVLVVTVALVGMGLFSGKLRYRCFDINDGTLEESFGRVRTCDASLPGAFTGRGCPEGYDCLSLGRYSLWSYDNIGMSSLSVMRIFFLNQWSDLYLMSFHSAGSIGAVFVFFVIFVGSFIGNNIFVPLIIMQLEKMKNSAYIETGRKVVRRALNVELALSFNKWKWEWQSAQNQLMERIKLKASDNPDVAAKYAMRFQGGNLKLRAWNNWVDAITAKAAPAELQDLMRFRGLEPPRTQRKRVKADVHDAPVLNDEESFSCTPQYIHSVIYQLAASSFLQSSMNFIVIAGLCLMGLKNSCSSFLGQALQCSPTSNTEWSVFNSRIEFTLMLSAMLFVFETCIKIIGFGPREFFRSGMNQLDFAVSLISLIDVALTGPCLIQNVTNTNSCENNSGSLQGLGSLRTLRLIRILRLLRSASRVKLLILQLVDLIRSAWSLILLIFLFAFIFSMIGFQMVATYSNEVSVSTDLERWYSKYSLMLIPGSRVFVQDPDNRGDRLEDMLPAVVYAVTNTDDLAAWYGFRYDCTVFSSFSIQLEDNKTSRVWATASLEAGRIDSLSVKQIRSVVNPLSSFISPADAFLTVLQIFLDGDWGAILEDVVFRVGFGGIAFVLSILLFGKVLLLSTYTAFVAVWLGRSLQATNEYVESKKVGKVQAPGLHNRMLRKAGEATKETEETAEKLDGLWVLVFQDGLHALEPIVIRHTGDGILTMRCALFKRNPTRAMLDHVHMSLTLLNKAKVPTMGRVVTTDLISWDNGQRWIRGTEEMRRKLQANSLLFPSNGLPKAEVMGDDPEMESAETHMAKLRAMLAHAAQTHSPPVEDRKTIMAWQRSKTLEYMCFWCLEYCYPFKNQGIYNQFDSIYVPWLRCSALCSFLIQTWRLMSSKYNQRVERANALFQAIQELRKNQDARNVFEVDLPNCSAAQLQAVFQDRKQKIQIEQAVDLYLSSVIDVLVSKRARLAEQKEEFIANNGGNIAYFNDQAKHIEQQISRLEDTKAMLQYDLTSCFLSRTSNIRKAASIVAKSFIFRGLIFLCVILNVITQGVDSPFLPVEGSIVLRWTDTVLNIFFTFEVFVLMLWQGRRAYLSDMWNKLDFTIVFFGGLESSATWIGGQFKNNANFAVLITCLKALRALRPLRLLRRAASLRRVGWSILCLIRTLGVSMGFGIAVFYIFAVLGLNLLLGQLNTCTNPILNQTECSQRGLKWDSSDFNFDWIGTSFLTSVSLTSRDSWPVTMSAGVSSTGAQTGPIERNRTEILAFYLIIVLFWNILMSNIFVGVLMQAYHDGVDQNRKQTLFQLRSAQILHSKLGGSKRFQRLKSRLLREPNEEVMPENEKVSRRDLPLLIDTSLNTLRSFFQVLSSSDAFDLSMQIMTLVACGMYSLDTRRASERQRHILATSDLFFLFLFSIETLIRCYALHPRRFYRSFWNRMNAVVVVMSLFALAFSRILSHTEFNSFVVWKPQILRGFQLVKILYYLGSAKALDVIIRGLIRSMNEIFCLALLCGIFSIAVATMTVQVFGGISLTNVENYLRCVAPTEMIHRNVPAAILSLLTISTQDWVTFMHQLSLVSSRHPRAEGAVSNAIRILNQRKASNSVSERLSLLHEVRKVLPGCVNDAEMIALEEAGAVECRTVYLGMPFTVPCIGSCGSEMSFFVCPVIAIFVGTVLINMIKAILLSWIKHAQTFVGNRAMVTPVLRKKKFRVIATMWLAKKNCIMTSNQYITNARCRVTVLQVCNLENDNSFGVLDVYFTAVIPPIMRKSKVKSGSLNPVWDMSEDLLFPVRHMPTTLTIRVYDRDDLDDSDKLLGTCEIPLNETVVKQRTLSSFGFLCISEKWHRLKGKKNSHASIRVIIDYFEVVETKGILGGPEDDENPEHKELLAISRRLSQRLEPVPQEVLDQILAGRRTQNESEEKGQSGKENDEHVEEDSAGNSGMDMGQSPTDSSSNALASNSSAIADNDSSENYGVKRSSRRKHRNNLKDDNTHSKSEGGSTIPIEKGHRKITKSPGEALFFAVDANRLDQVREIVTGPKGGKALRHTDEQGCTVLHKISDSESNIALVRFLLQQGADPQIRDAMERRPIDVARAAGCKGMCLLYRQWHRLQQNIPDSAQSQENWAGDPGMKQVVLSTTAASATASVLPSARELPPTPSQVRLLIRQGVPSQFLPASRQEASRLIRHMLKPTPPETKQKIAAMLSQIPVQEQDLIPEWNSSFENGAPNSEYSGPFGNRPRSTERSEARRNLAFVAPQHNTLYVNRSPQDNHRGHGSGTVLNGYMSHTSQAPDTAAYATKRPINGNDGGGTVLWGDLVHATAASSRSRWIEEGASERGASDNFSHRQRAYSGGNDIIAGQSILTASGKEVAAAFEVVCARPHDQRLGRRVSMRLVGELLELGVPVDFIPTSRDCAARLARSMRALEGTDTSWQPAPVPISRVPEVSAYPNDPDLHSKPEDDQTYGRPLPDDHARSSPVLTVEQDEVGSGTILSRGREGVRHEATNHRDHEVASDSTRIQGQLADSTSATRTAKAKTDRPARRVRDPGASASGRRVV